MFRLSSAQINTLHRARLMGHTLQVCANLASCSITTAFFKTEHIPCLSRRNKNVTINRKTGKVFRRCTIADLHNTIRSAAARKAKAKKGKKGKGKK